MSGDNGDHTPLYYSSPDLPPQEFETLKVDRLTIVVNADSHCPRVDAGWCRFVELQGFVGRPCWWRRNVGVVIWESNWRRSTSGSPCNNCEDERD
jgi:hypothetical protein